MIIEQRKSEMVPVVDERLIVSNQQDRVPGWGDGSVDKVLGLQA